MMCAWKPLLALLPPGIRQELTKQDEQTLQEVRLRLGAPPELVGRGGDRWGTVAVKQEDLAFVINAASGYSPWAAQTLAKGYLTADGGHRVGVSGKAVVHQGVASGIREPESVCIRVARDFPELGSLQGWSGSALILGAPGWGKTTLLRSLSRKLADKQIVSVVDERGELFPQGMPRGRRMDVLTGCPKPQGIDWMLRTMGPQWIALDEITAEEDAAALLQAANCGVHLLATAHAASKQELLERKPYQALAEHHVFESLLILKQDQTYHVERMGL